MNPDPIRPDPSAPPAAGKPADASALPAGTRFGEFEILRVLGAGGFGIVYLAQDHSLERLVALKEYMPASLAARGVGPTIAVRPGADAASYATGLRSFINEARLLARFDHPSLVKVHRCWEDNGTAYMVMPYLPGATLRDARRAMTQPPDEAWLRGVLDAMLDALAQLHAVGVYHRDLAPDNIVLPPGAPPILLDFGAARRVLADGAPSLTAVLKPSYAPIEQYAETPGLRQGPWTDLYALGAVMHFLLFGEPPAPSTARTLQGQADPVAQVAQRSVPGVSARFIGVVAWMLGVHPGARPQSVAALRAALDGETDVPMQIGDEVTQPGYAPPAPDAPALAAPPMPSAAAAAAPVAVGLPDDDVIAAALPAPPPMPALPLRRRRAAALVAGLGAAALIAAAVLWQFVELIASQRPAGAALAGDAAVPPHLEPAGANASNASTPATEAARGDTTFATRAGVAQRQAVAPAAPANVAAPIAAVAVSASAPMRVPAVGVDRAATSTGVDAPRPPRQTRHPNPARASQRAATVAANRAPATARAACGDRQFIALAICMDRECERPRYHADRECVRVLEFKRRRNERGPMVSGVD